MESISNWQLLSITQLKNELSRHILLKKKHDQIVPGERNFIYHLLKLWGTSCNYPAFKNSFIGHGRITKVWLLKENLTIPAFWVIVSLKWFPSCGIMEIKIIFVPPRSNIQIIRSILSFGVSPQYLTLGGIGSCHATSTSPITDLDTEVTFVVWDRQH